MPTRDLAAVILAAGKGTRMKSGLSKLAHDVMGKPIVSYVAHACREAGVPRLIAIVGYDAERVKAALGPDLEYVYQHEQLGTGHALMMAEPVLRGFIGDIFVLAGDAPFITAKMLRDLLEKHRQEGQAATFLTAAFNEVPPYGRVIRDAKGRVQAIVEEVDCTPEQKLIEEVNSSHYCFRAEVVLPLLHQIQPNLRTGEYFLTDIVDILNRHGHAIATRAAADGRVVRGINDRRDLVDAIALMREQVTNALLESGVTILDPATTFIDSTVTIGRDTIVYSHSHLATGTAIGERCHIGPFVELRGARVGDEARLSFVSVRGAEVKSEEAPEPFQRITASSPLGKISTASGGRRKITVSTPGRICLFGEHQDYLGLPVIAAAISLRIRLTGVERNDAQFQISLPDVRNQIFFDLNGRRAYELERDYFRSGHNVLWDRGMRLRRGWSCEVRGDIPINSGTASSSALMVAWIKFLLAAAREQGKDNPDMVARLAHRAEVLEFDEPGGMMDHFSTSYGGVIYLDFTQGEVHRLSSKLGTFVLGDSQQSKDTKGGLASLKTIALEAVDLMRKHLPNFDLRTTSHEEAQDELARLPQRHAQVLQANLIDRDLLRHAYQILHTDPIDHHRLGELLALHHEQLSRHKRISTEKIDGMIAAAIKAGAYGGKINGSGGGGCMFAYAPEDPQAVAEAIKAAGGIPYVVTIDEGSSIDEGCLTQDFT